MAANKLTVSGNTINLTFDGSTNDINFASYFPNGIRINSVQFVASAATDMLALKVQNDTGALLVAIVGSNSWVPAQPVRAFPYLDYSACTLGTPGSCYAIIELA